MLRGEPPEPPSSSHCPVSAAGRSGPGTPSLGQRPGAERRGPGAAHARRGSKRRWGDGALAAWGAGSLSSQGDGAGRGDGALAAGTTGCHSSQGDGATGVGPGTAAAGAGVSAAAVTGGREPGWTAGSMRGRPVPTRRAASQPWPARECDSSALHREPAWAGGRGGWPRWSAPGAAVTGQWLELGGSGGSGAPLHFELRRRKFYFWWRPLVCQGEPFELERGEVVEFIAAARAGELGSSPGCLPRLPLCPCGVEGAEYSESLHPAEGIDKFNDLMRAPLTHDAAFDGVFTHLTQVIGVAGVPDADDGIILADELSPFATESWHIHPFHIDEEMEVEVPATGFVCHFQAPTSSPPIFTEFGATEPGESRLDLGYSGSGEEPGVATGEDEVFWLSHHLGPKFNRGSAFVGYFGLAPGAIDQITPVAESGCCPTSSADAHCPHCATPGQWLSQVLLTECPNFGHHELVVAVIVRLSGPRHARLRKSRIVVQPTRVFVIVAVPAG